MIEGVQGYIQSSPTAETDGKGGRGWSEVGPGYVGPEIGSGKGQSGRSGVFLNLSRRKRIYVGGAVYIPLWKGYI